MSPQYAVLNGRPIDKWRVTELRDELKKRNMITKGLKDDLVKRLDEAIRQDMENSDQEEATGVNSGTQSVGKGDVVGEEPQLGQTLDCTIQPSENRTFDMDETAPSSVIAEDGGLVPNDDVVGEEPQLNQSLVGTVQPSENKTSNMGVITEDGGLVPNDDEVSKDNTHLDQSEYSFEETSLIVNVNVVTSVSEKSLESNLEKKGGPTEIDDVPVVSQSDNQVYEVMPDLGSHVKSESFSSVSILKKNELHDNLNANNADLVLDAFKFEKVQSSTSGGPASGGDWPLLVDQKIIDDKGSVDETVDNKSIHVDNIEGDDTAKGESLEELKHVSADNYVEEELQDSKKNDLISSIKVEVKSHLTEVTDSKDISMVTKLSHTIMETRADGKSASFGSAEEVPIHDDNTGGTVIEKLNLDNYAEDDFMEEDTVETNQVDSNASPCEAAYMVGAVEVPGAKSEFIVDSANSVKIKSSSEKNGYDDTAPSEKRKFKDEVADEPPKRQRRWNSESVKAPERLIYDIKPCATPKDSHQSIKTESTIGRPDSTVGEDAPKERIVPPSSKPSTTSLRIDQFVRPFTLKAVQELLVKTGKVCSFWMDQIKTHCYVMYSTVEEAEETRKSVYNLQWPPNGGRFLVAEFVDPQEVKMRVEPVSTSLSTTPTVSAAPGQQQTPSARQQSYSKQQNISPLPPPPPVAEIEPPIVTLDDLFKKTIAIPRIYYLPLSEQQVSAKIARGNNGRRLRN